MTTDGMEAGRIAVALEPEGAGTASTASVHCARALAGAAGVLFMITLGKQEARIQRAQIE